ncbi:MAG: SBBP repeat-containing protein [Bryobacteraceae bacterium]
MIGIAPRFVLLASFIVFPGFAQGSRPDLRLGAFANQSVSARTVGGSGNDTINAAAVDAAGNIYVTGTTSSFDFPLANAFQGANSGTQLVFSSDAGATWQPLGTPLPAANPELWPVSVAADPTNGRIVYVAYGDQVCKSADGGRQFDCVTIAFASSQTTVTSIAIDPQQPLTVYASAYPNGGVFKSVDGGQTWANASQGLPSQGFVISVAIDPFHANAVYAWADNGGWVSNDGAASWTPSSLQWPTNTYASDVHFAFDPVTPGIIYGPWFSGTQFGLQKSTDGGATWTQLSTPFVNSGVVPDPKVSGVLYAVAPPVNAQTASSPFWKSTDGGATWTSTPCPADSLAVLAVDPANPLIMVAGPFRSTDGGQTWSPTNLSRDVQPAFAPSTAGLIYATGTITSDAFVAKFSPGGKLAFSTYFGGMGNDAGQGIALDGAGNIWIAGSTSSYDLPVTPGAYQSALHGTTNAFAAKFSNDGKLLAATYLGGSSGDSGFGIAIDPQGDPWLIGNWTSADFPFTTAPLAATSDVVVGFLSELDPSAARLLYSANVGAEFDKNGKGIAIDPSGNITLTGSAWGAFPVTPGAFQAGTSDPNAPRVFVVKLNPSGSVIYSTFFGGTAGSPATGNYEPSQDFGVAVALDNAGSAYLTGSTNDTDFPTTAGAYQTTLAAGCAYPAFSIATGWIGSLYRWMVDDVFVVKLSADGKTALFSTLLGGSCYDRPTSLALDGAGRVYVAGETDSGDFPLLSNLEPVPASPYFASFLSIFDPAGSALDFSTYLYAGSAPSVVAGPRGTVGVAGSTGSGAQTSPYGGACFLGPCPPTTTHGYLTLIEPREERPALDHPPGLIK